MTTMTARTRMLWARGRMVLGVLGLALGAWLGLSADPTLAGTFASSQSAYWKVGNLDEKLTKACRRGLFNQKKANRYNILFVGKDGRTITGIATTGWNLSDPRGLAEKGYTFHFFNDGYSDCRVYVAKAR